MKKPKDGRSGTTSAADSEVAVTERIPKAIPTPAAPDPRGEAVADFLADLLDNVEVLVRTDAPPDTTAAQKGPLWWAALHRDHHRSDDIHSPLKGF